MPLRDGPYCRRSAFDSGATVSSTCGIFLNSNNITNALSMGGSATLSSGSAAFTMVTGAKISASGSDGPALLVSRGRSVRGD